ncbi:MAG: RHS repeat-associated core domain-containing protein [Saprospiraceae bacterium]
MDYTYLENGFLQSINDGTIGGTTMTPDLCSPALPNPGNTGENDLFQLKLNYDQVELGASGTSQYNGNIAQLIWRVRGRERQTYGFDYDFLNRLDLANYYDITDGGTPRSSTNKYSVDIGYADDRGNIGSITRNGLYWDGSCWVEDEIDDLTFAYYPGTNRLKDVDDAATNATAAEEGFKPYTIGDSSADYFYDENGNLIFDPSKELSTSYNYLNLPQRIEDADCKVLEFTYDAAGMKLRKTVKDGAITITTQDYVGGIEYRGGVMEAIYHSEGRVYFEDGSSRYEYSLTDHLGNTRLMFSDKNGNGVVDMSDDPETTEVLQENHYYPFGMQMKGSWMDNPGRESKYTYNGKELNQDLRLNWLDYGARWYDPSIGRWNAVDPLAELDNNLALSTYHYVSNNPVANIDPDGMNWYRSTETGEVHWQKGSKDLDGYENLGEYYIHEGEDNYIVHYQNEVVATVSKATGDYEEAYTRQIQHMAVPQEFKDNSRLTEALFETGSLIQEALLLYGPIPKAGLNIRAFSPAFKTNTIKSLIKGLKKLPSTKGRATLYESGGGFKQALKDFWSFKPTNVKKIVTPKGLVQTGKLKDGTTVTIREFSSTKRGAISRSTMDIQRPDVTRKIEIRY